MADHGRGDADDAILNQAKAIEAQRAQDHEDELLVFCQEFFDAVGAKLAGGDDYGKDYEVGKVARFPEVVRGGGMYGLKRKNKERYVCRMRVPAGDSSNLNVILAYGRASGGHDHDQWLLLRNEVDVDEPVSVATQQSNNLMLFPISHRDQAHLSGVYHNQQHFTRERLVFLDNLEPVRFRGYHAAYLAKEVVDEIFEFRGKVDKSLFVDREVRTVYFLGDK